MVCFCMTEQEIFRLLKFQLGGGEMKDTIPPKTLDLRPSEDLCFCVVPVFSHFAHSTNLFVFMVLSTVS